MLLSRITIPKGLTIEELPDDNLPAHWDAIVAGSASQHFGDLWLRQLRSAVLSVPSSIIPSERNFVLNPAHPAFRKIHFAPPQPFVFDPRLRAATASF